MKISEISIPRRHRKELGDLSALAASIERVGLLHPIVITPEHRLIAGERRLRAVELLGWADVPVTIVESLDDAISLLIAESHENTCRKDFLPSEAYEIASALEPLERDAAKQRQAWRAERSTPSGNLPEGEKSTRDQSRDRLAEAVGVSGRTLDKICEVVEAAREDPDKFGDLVERMDRTGNVHGAYKRVKRRKRDDAIPAASWPTGKYGVIYADPPWKPDESVLDPTREIENAYPTMTIDELIALAPTIDALALDDCVLLMWTVAPKLPDAVRLVDAWGFEYKTSAVWVKPSIGMGYWFRARHELLFVAVRGAPLTPTEENRPDSVITAPRLAHSQKPDLVYGLIERMFPNVPKVEIFARAERAGWARATNEIELRPA